MLIFYHPLSACYVYELGKWVEDWIKELGFEAHCCGTTAHKRPFPSHCHNNNNTIASSFPHWAASPQMTRQDGCL